MASKRKSNQQRNAIRNRQKRVIESKKAFRYSLIHKSFDDVKPKTIPPISYHPDTFEYILADTKNAQMIQEKTRLDILFRRF